ncbi:hypothetical protein FPS14_contig00026-0028 [Flavobacterium psychrophilum]|nr:hypothetical protein FPS14_contig00026-0028 [Flavobacterium psychrophilum]
MLKNDNSSNPIIFRISFIQENTNKITIGITKYVTQILLLSVKTEYKITPR